MLRNSNTIIGKYSLSFFYYKDIILSEGNLDAQYNLAICYMDGIGSRNTKRRRKAFVLFLKSIQPNKSRVHRNKMRSKFEMNLESVISNNLIAQNKIGYHFQYGKGEGQYSLGSCYEYGKGTDKNETKAFEWYLQSAVNGDAMSQTIIGCTDGQYNLGYFYENGKGTDKNKIKAFEWYTKAAENGDAVAKNNLEKYGIKIAIKDIVAIVASIIGIIFL
ncbi:hypothetical protein C1646_771314 [Rhizophagus diaphanus]|nr:hypothetical protein C1646_771314 [Rhizophagus diaphanus] [Rhizophagus sp. MUCL 43196]